MKSRRRAGRERKSFWRNATQTLSIVPASINAPVASQCTYRTAPRQQMDENEIALGTYMFQHYVHASPARRPVRRASCMRSCRSNKPIIARRSPPETNRRRRDGRCFIKELVPIWPSSPDRISRRSTSRSSHDIGQEKTKIGERHKRQ